MSRPSTGEGGRKDILHPGHDFDLKLKTDQITGAEGECPKNCPPPDKKGVKAYPGGEFGCVTICNECFEASVPGNLALGLATGSGTLGTGSGWLGIRAYLVFKSITSGTYQYTYTDEWPEQDQNAVKLGRILAGRTGGAAPDRAALCKLLSDRKRDTLQMCPCPPCPSPGKYPPLPPLKKKK